MANKIKKTLSMVLVMCMLVSVLPMQALAADSADPTEGLELIETPHSDSYTDENSNTVEKVTVEKTSDPAVENLIVNETTTEVTVTAPDGFVLEESSVTDSFKIETEENLVDTREDSSEPVESAPVESEVKGSDLTVDLLDNGVKVEASVNPDHSPVVEEDVQYSEDGLTKTTTTVTENEDGSKTTVVKTEVTSNPGTSEVVGSDTTGPVANEFGGTTTVETTTIETLDKVVETTVETTVVTERELEATLNKGQSVTDSDIDEELVVDETNLESLETIIGKLSTEERPLDTSNLANDKNAILEALKAGKYEGDNANVANIVAALLANGTVTRPTEENTDKPTHAITVSEVSFTVKDKVADSDVDATNDVYNTELSFKVVVDTDITDGTTTVTILDENNNTIKSADLKDIPQVDGKYVLSNLELAEGMNYNLQFDYEGSKSLGGDEYNYSTSIETTTMVKEKETVRVNIGNDTYSGPAVSKPTNDYSIQTDVNQKNTAHVKGVSGIAAGNYTVIGLDGKAHRASMYNNGKLYIDMDTPENGDNYLPTGTEYGLPTSKGDESTITLIDKDGNVSTLVVSLQSSFDCNGHNVYNFKAYTELTAEIEVEKPKRTTTDYNSSFVNNKSESVESSTTMVLNFSVNEATKTESSEFSVVENFTVTESVKTTTTWHSESKETFTPAPEEPEEDPVEPVNGDGPVPFRLGNNNTIIEEEPVPLAAPVATGDNAVLWIAVIMMAMFAIVIINFPAKKRENETF